jgi:hypothetical protein
MHIVLIALLAAGSVSGAPDIRNRLGTKVRDWTSGNLCLPHIPCLHTHAAGHSARLEKGSHLPGSIQLAGGQQLLQRPWSARIQAAGAQQAAAAPAAGMQPTSSLPAGVQQVQPMPEWREMPEWRAGAGRPTPSQPARPSQARVGHQAIRVPSLGASSCLTSRERERRRPTPTARRSPTRPPPTPCPTPRTTRRTCCCCCRGTALAGRPRTGWSSCRGYLGCSRCGRSPPLAPASCSVGGAQESSCRPQDALATDDYPWISGWRPPFHDTPFAAGELHPTGGPPRPACFHRSPSSPPSSPPRVCQPQPQPQPVPSTPSGPPPITRRLLRSCRRRRAVVPGAAPPRSLPLRLPRALLPAGLPHHLHAGEVGRSSAGLPACKGTGPGRLPTWRAGDCTTTTTATTCNQIEPLPPPAPGSGTLTALPCARARAHARHVRRRWPGPRRAPVPSPRASSRRPAATTWRGPMTPRAAGELGAA